MNLTIWGAAKQVTGSMHLLEINNYKILIDCGLDYEKGKDLTHNSQFPFSPSDIDLVVLTHAHIDHSGNLPTLIKEGYTGQILCTAATAELAQILLSDSVSLFLGNNNNVKKKKRSKGKQFQETTEKAPLYLHKHVLDTIDRFVTIPFQKPFQINSNIVLELYPTGHLLGAAAAHFTVQDNGSTKTIAFTGDIGRKQTPILVDPVALPKTDFLVSESTYGGKLHTNQQNIEDFLIDSIQKNCIDQPGRLIIPAFSVGRTQSLVYILNKIFSKKLLKPIPVFVDSPLANLATDIHRKYKHILNDEVQEFYRTHGDKFEFENLSYVKQLKESKEIANHFEPCIIISSAGMLEGGRIQDHLYRNIQNVYATILFIGYCAEGTLGHRLLRGDNTVRLKGKEMSVFAKITKTDLFSGHADHNGLLEYIRLVDGLPKQVFLVHGEPIGMEALKKDIESFGCQVNIAHKGNVFIL